MSNIAIDVLPLTITAETEVEANHFVNITGSQVSVAGGEVDGIAQYDAQPGEDFYATVIGMNTVIAGGPIAKGDRVASDAEGRAITDPGGGAAIAGKALSDTTGPNELVQVLIK
jgi:hypothetical protein